MVFDFTPFIGPAVTIIIAIVGGYIAMKNAINDQILEIMSSIASINALLSDIQKDVAEHNDSVKRIYVLETEMKTAFIRIDEMKELIKSIQDELRNR